uniref:StAR related lipid transfer domain containing 13 n=1 Tax=Oryctolagus cuniculus TaxID=9986 RepID=A0A5F9DII3_RABIT
MTSKRKPFQTQLRRSISEQLRDSTARAWDLLWKNVRERRLAALAPELGHGHGQKKEV